MQSTPTSTEWHDAVAAFDQIGHLILFEIAESPARARGRTIGGFIARSLVTVRSIETLWALGDTQGCWILHRALLDRLFHLWSIDSRNEFELFERWSFLRQFEAIKRLRSDREIRKDQRDAALPNLTEEDEALGRALEADRPNWRRPKASDVAKEMGAGVLYRYGYDYGSTHVHPMATDGSEDFYRLTGRIPEKPFPDESAVVWNSLLVSVLLVQQALRASSRQWVAPVHVCLNEIWLYAGTGQGQFAGALLQALELVRSGTPLADGRGEERG